MTNRWKTDAVRLGAVLTLAWGLTSTGLRAEPQATDLVLSVTEGVTYQATPKEIREKFEPLAEVIGKALRRNVKVVLVPAGPGTGVKAGAGVRDVLECAGIHNILTKVHGSTNPINLVKATINGLLQLRTREEVARLRGVAL